MQLVQAGPGMWQHVPGIWYHVTIGPQNFICHNLCPHFGGSKPPFLGGPLEAHGQKQRARCSVLTAANCNNFTDATGRAEAIGELT